MSINELRAQYRSSEGRAKQGFISPVGEVDEQQLMELVAGSSVGPNSTCSTTTIISAAFGCSDQCASGPVLCATQNICQTMNCATQNQCGVSYRPGDIPQC